MFEVIFQSKRKLHWLFCPLLGWFYGSSISCTCADCPHTGETDSVPCRKCLHTQNKVTITTVKSKLRGETYLSSLCRINVSYNTISYGQSTSVVACFELYRVDSDKVNFYLKRNRSRQHNKNLSTSMITQCKRPCGASHTSQSERTLVISALLYNNVYKTV